MLNYKEFLYTLDPNLLSDTQIINNFLHSVGCLFTFLIVIFDAQKFNFDEVHLIYFFSDCSDCFWYYIRPLPNQGLKDLHLYFLLRVLVLAYV